MKMEIVPEFVIQNAGVQYFGKAMKVPYSEIWQRMLGRIRETYPQYEFNRKGGDSKVSLHIAVMLGAYESKAKTVYVVSTEGVPTARIYLPALTNTTEIVEAILSGIVGVLQRIYPTYFPAGSKVEELSKLLVRITPEQKHPDLSVVSDLAAAPVDMDGGDSLTTRRDTSLRSDWSTDDLIGQGPSTDAFIPGCD